MYFYLDFGQLELLARMNFLELFWYFFSHGGWIFLLLLFAKALYDNFLANRRKKYLSDFKWALLAVDIPKDNEQSMVAIEQLFAHLAGLKRNFNLVEKYWYGMLQSYVSLEILSLEGYIQFLIRTPEHYRDLVEAAIYAQYPEAEITEVEDYVDLIPEDAYQWDYDYILWGTDFKFNKPNPYPFKTYRSFEHPLSQTFNDPMAALLEIMSKLGKGEQLALQLVISPIKDNWKEQGYQLVKKLIGQKIESKEHLGDKFVKSSLKGIEYISEQIYQLWSEVEEKNNKKNEPYNLMLNLTPGERFVVEAIQNKLAQPCFGVRFRMYYLAHKDKFAYNRGVNAILGAINQFNTSNLNAFAKNRGTQTYVDYFFVKTRISKRRKRLIKNFKARTYYTGAADSKAPKLLMMSNEELATLYHFPTISVKAPLVKRAEVKKAEPPTSLPVKLADQGLEAFKFPEPESEEKTTEEPFTIKESLPGYDFDNNYYEERFAKNLGFIKPKKETEAITKNQKAEPPTNLPIA